jgi:tetratricopeptide (TPR) repeat protein
MKPLLLRLLPFVALILPLHAQSDKARKFYDALLKRPVAPALFDQFYNTWLDTDPVEKLESFLTAESEKSVDAQMILAAFHARQGALDKAVTTWRAVLQKEPQGADAWLALAKTEARQQNRREALQAVEDGLRIKPAPELERKLMEFKARTLALDGQRSEAAEVWQELLKRNHDDAELRDDYIDLLVQTGDAEAAAEEARLDPDAKPAEEGLAELQRKMDVELLARFANMPDEQLLSNERLTSRLCENLLVDHTAEVMKLLTRLEALSPADGSGPRRFYASETLDRIMGGWTPEAAPDVQARRLRVILTILAESPPSVSQPQNMASHLHKLLRPWLTPETPVKRFILPGSLPLMIARVKSLPPGFLTEKQALLLFPQALEMAGYVPHQGLSDKISDAVAEALEKECEAGPLRDTLVDAFRLAAMNYHREAEYERLRRINGKIIDPQRYSYRDFHQFLPLPGMETVEDLIPCQQRFFKYLTDESIPGETRWFLFTWPIQSSLLHRIPRLLDPPLFAAAVPLAKFQGSAEVNIKHIRGYSAVVDLAAAAVLFEDLPGGKPREAERLMAEQLREIAGTAYLSARSLVMAARSATDERLLEIMRGLLRPAANTSLAGTLRTLVHYRRFASAALLLSEGPDRLFTDREDNPHITELYTPETDAALRDWLATLPDGPLRIAARTLVDASHDSIRLMAEKGPSQNERLEVLAKAMQREELSLTWLRRLLLVFPKDSPARESLEPLMAKSIEGSTLPEMMQAPKARRALYFRYLQARAVAGDFAPLRKAMQEVNSLPEKEQEPAEQQLGTFMQDAVIQSCLDWPASVRSAALETLRAAVFDPAAIRRRTANEKSPWNYDCRLGLCLAMHAAWDFMPEWEKAWLALTEPGRTHLEANARAAVTAFRYLGIHSLVGHTNDIIRLLPRELNRPHGPIVARLVASPHGLPGYLPGQLYSAQKHTFEFDATPVLALSSALAERRDATAHAVRADVAVILLEAGRTEEAKRLVPGIKEQVDAVPEEHRLHAMQLRFEILKGIEGPAAALKWIAANGALLTKKALSDQIREIRNFTRSMCLADAALLKSAGPDAWKEAVLARLTSAPESALGLFLAATALERIADLEAAAGRNEQALTAMSLSVLTAGGVRQLNDLWMDAQSRALFTANYADLAMRAGRKIDIVELLPLESEWWHGTAHWFGQMQERWQRGRAPLGWGKPAPATVVSSEPSPTRGYESAFSINFSLTNKEIRPDEEAVLYYTLCDVDGPDRAFSINVSHWTKAETDPGRPERTPELSVLTKNSPAAGKAANPKTGVLSTLGLTRQDGNYLTVFVPPDADTRPSLRFDAALHALRVNFPQVLEDCRERRATLEAAAPPFWKKLPPWVRRE